MTPLDQVIIENSDFSDIGEGTSVVGLTTEDSPLSVEIRNSRFVDNQTTALQVNGGMAGEYGEMPTIRVLGSEFVNNIALYGEAGAIAIDGVDVWSDGASEMHFAEPVVHLEGNLYRGNLGELAGAVYFGGIDGDFEGATNQSDFGEVVVIDRSTFEDNTAEDLDSRSNDILVESAEPEVPGDTQEECDAGLTAMHVLNSTFSNENTKDASVSFGSAECVNFVFDHTTFVGAGIFTGETSPDVAATVLLRNTVFDTDPAQTITSEHDRGPFVVTEDHVAYNTVPDAELVPEGPGRIVAPSSDLALGDFTTVDAESDGLAYTTSVRVPGIIAGTDPEEASVLTGAGVTVADPRLALDQAGDPRPGAATRAAAQPTIGAVEGTAPKETAPPGPVDPVTPEPVDPKPVDPKPVDPAPVAPKVDPASPVLANTGSAMNATNWFILAGVLVVAAGALFGANRLLRKREASGSNGESNEAGQNEES